MLIYKLKRPLWQERASNPKTHYSTEIITNIINIVKNKFSNSFRSKNSEITTPIQFSQDIQEPDGVKLQVFLSGTKIFLTDKNENIVEFSAYLLPELRSSLLDAEKVFGRKL